MKKIIISILFSFCTVVVFGQNVTVRGTVKDLNGDPVVGAIVALQGSTTVGSSTDANGQYTLQVPSDAVLEASCLGYRKQTSKVGKSAVLNFVLEEDSEQLEEAVAVGYGSMRRSDITGAVMSVRIDEDIASKSTTFDQLLDGHAAGVQVLSDNSNPDSGISIRIRGINTFSGHSEPLYVVDGVIIEGESDTPSVFAEDVGDNASRERESTNALAGINPQDIASVEILKDASATAIYGSQGANGVVLITTKQAQKDKPTVNFNSGIGIGRAGSHPHILSFDEYVNMVFDYNTAGNYKKLLYEYPEDRAGLKVEPQNWADYVFRTSISQRYFLSIAGKPNGLNYYLSLGYNRTEGVIKLTDSDALSARINLSKEIFKKFKLSFKTSFGYTKSNLVNGANNSGSSKNYNSVMASLYCVPFVGNDDEMSEIISDANERRGPVKFAEGNTNISERIRVTPSLAADWKINKILSFNSTFGMDFTYAQSSKSKDYIVSMGHGNIAGYSEAMALSYNWDNVLLAKWKKGRHNLSGTLGMSMSRRSRSVSSVSAKNLPQKFARGIDINDADPANSYYNSYGETESSLLSFFGRAVYNYSERYILTATLRFDGSSKFLGANKWGVFPSLAAAWRITSEPWFNVPCISNAKLRLGWGMTGNQNIGSYLTGTVYASDFNSSHYETGKILSIYDKNIANAGLKWETTVQQNAGIDLGMFNGRIALTVDAYNKDTYDLLQSKAIAYSTGFTEMNVNDGQIRNRGLEITVEGVPVKSGKTEWLLGANIGFNRNEVVSVGAMGDSGMIFLNDHSPEQQLNYFYGDKVYNSLCTSPVNIFIEGQPMGLFYGYKTDGIVQVGEVVNAFSADTYRDEGTVKYKDLNGNGFIDKGDRTVIGNPHPLFNYGFNSTFTFGNFIAKVDFSGAYKFDIANMNNVIGYNTKLASNCFREAYTEAWTVDNPSDRWPKFGAPVDDLFSDRYVEDGSYFKLSNVSLSYVFKFKKTARILHALVLTGSVGNVYIWTNYSGYNPTSNSFGNDIKRIGVDLNSSPYARTYNFDVKFRF